jgi:hypothetical protein
LAIAFHWQPADMGGMDLAELMNWRELARERMEPDKDR